MKKLGLSTDGYMLIELLWGYKRGLGGRQWNFQFAMWLPSNYDAHH